MAQIWIPSLLRNMTGGAETVKVEGRTVGECLENLDSLYPGIRDRLCEGDDLIATLNVAVDGQINRRRLKARIQRDSELHFIPAIAGG
jgi:molybdopterin synthase sulfur carrier subunit